eukprot:TRINITY_DN4580_c0_g2_i2.p1 TRINITY_DN4580_c0_g2~~TRINITY_DN4580_c0_g2_i2.p1  ORF type:complete len:193 (+),score=-23.35 TRINITY_DN4580_c0_g2_i2:1229-1807(+)
MLLMSGFVIAHNNDSIVHIIEYIRISFISGLVITALYYNITNLLITVSIAFLVQFLVLLYYKIYILYTTNTLCVSGLPGSWFVSVNFSHLVCIQIQTCELILFLGQQQMYKQSQFFRSLGFIGIIFSQTLKIFTRINFRVVIYSTRYWVLKLIKLLRRILSRIFNSQQPLHVYACEYTLATEQINFFHTSIQ